MSMRTRCSEIGAVTGRSGTVFALLVSLLLWSAVSTALDPDKPAHMMVSDTWSIEEGLPQISGLALAQDHQGYIWVGTQAGLARFDGARFVAFNPATDPGLPGIMILSLLVASDGRLWVGTYKGLAVLDDGEFRTVEWRDGIDISGSMEVHALAETADGRVLAATSAGVLEVVDDTLALMPGSPGTPTFALLAGEDAIWTGVTGGLWRIVGGHGNFLPLRGEAEDARVARLWQGHDQLWVGSTHGLHRVAEDRLVPTAGHPDLEAAAVNALIEDDAGTLWVATRDSLFRLRDGRIVDMPSAGGAVPREIHAFLQDRESNLWLGGRTDGVTRLWNGWTLRYSAAEGIADPVLWSLAAGSNGGVWMGNNDGLHLLQDGAITQQVSGTALPHPSAYTLFAEGDTIWIGTRAGLRRWDRSALDVPPELRVLDSLQVNGILRGTDGRLWIATTGGLYSWAPGELQRFGREQGMQDPRVRVLLQRADGSILAGTQSGLMAIVDGRPQSFGAETGLPAGLDITALHELPDGRLLVGSLSENLLLYDGNAWSDLAAIPGVPVNSPFFITHDKQGWLWVAGIRGVYRLPIEQLAPATRGELAHIDGEMLLNERGDSRGGQQGYCCNGAGNGKGFIADDRLWLPSRDGAVVIGSAHIVRNPVPPSLVIERMRVAGEWVEVADLSQAAIQRLPLGARDVAFEFTALSFQQPESVIIRYRLDGYDDDWILLDDPLRRQAIYTNLPPGNYRLEIEAANNAGLWNRSATGHSFLVPPYFHETVWFKLLLALAFIALAWLVVRLRLQRLSAHERALEVLVSERTEALAEANRQLEQMTHTDPLTGLHNRRYLQQQLPVDLAFYDREARRPGFGDNVMVLAMADIDHFKRVNDRYGHPAGDLVIRQFAGVLMRLVRECDYVVRWGGEEFLLVFRPMPRSESLRIAERIRQAVAANPFELDNGLPLSLTCSIGFVEYPLFRSGISVLNWEQLVELADRALYYVKTRGRDGWATFRPADGTSLESLASLLQERGRDLLGNGLLEVVSSRADVDQSPAG